MAIPPNRRGGPTGVGKSTIIDAWAAVDSRREHSMVKRILLAVCAMSLALNAAAQTIGTYALWPDVALDTSGISFGPPPADPARTYVNLSGPATSNGTIRMIAFRAAPATACTDGAKVKFFHRSGNTINLFAERGPFTVTGNMNKFTLSAPVDVQAGDLIALTLLRDCGLGGLRLGPIAQSGKGDGTAFIAGDASGSFSLVPNGSAPQVKLMSGISLAVFGSSTVDAEIRSQVIVVAGAATGVGGSRFKTDIQLASVPGPEFIFNAPLRSDTVLGRLVYHRAGTSGSPSDVSVSFKLAPGENRTLPDFVGGLGLSGLGSIDIYTTVGFEAPLAVAHIYEDSAGATKGLTTDALLLDRALTEDAVLFAPTDPSKFRMNIGVRTLDQPVTLGFVIFRANGTARTNTVTIDFPANYFAQNGAEQMLGTPLQAGDAIVVRAGAAPVFVYGSTTDNVSQDPSIQFASVLR